MGGRFFRLVSVVDVWIALIAIKIAGMKIKHATHSCLLAMSVVIEAKPHAISIAYSFLPKKTSIKYQTTHTNQLAFY